MALATFLLIFGPAAAHAQSFAAQQLLGNFATGNLSTPAPSSGSEPSRLAVRIVEDVSTVNRARANHFRISASDHAAIEPERLDQLNPPKSR